MRPDARGERLRLTTLGPAPAAGEAQRAARVAWRVDDGEQRGGARSPRDGALQRHQAGSRHGPLDGDPATEGIVVILYYAVEPPHRWIILDRRDRLVDYGLAESPDQIPAAGRQLARRIGVVPGELATMHTLRIPARSRAKAGAAVPYMLEERLASNVEDLEFRLLYWARGGDSKVAVMSREAVAGWQERLRQLPWRTDALVPEYLVLPRHTHGRCTVARDERRRLVIRVGDYDGLVIDEQELGLW